MRTFQTSQDTRGAWYSTFLWEYIPEPLPLSLGAAQDPKSGHGGSSRTP